MPRSRRFSVEDVGRRGREQREVAPAERPDLDRVRIGRHRDAGPQARAIWLCLRAMNAFAVSTATAASRQ